jgi:hypothetical protein
VLVLNWDVPDNLTPDPSAANFITGGTSYFAAFPYARELLQSLSARLGLDSVVLGPLCREHFAPEAITTIHHGVQAGDQDEPNDPVFVLLGWSLVSSQAGTFSLRRTSTWPQQHQQCRASSVFCVKILSAWARKSPRVAEVLPMLYLRGLCSPISGRREVFGAASSSNNRTNPQAVALTAHDTLVDRC